MVRTAGVVLLNLSTIFSLTLVSSGASLGGRAAVFWDLVACFCCVLPVGTAVQELLKYSPEATSLTEAVAKHTSSVAASFVAVSEWAAAMIFTVPLLSFVALGVSEAFGLQQTGLYLAMSVLLQMALFTAIALAGIDKAVASLSVLTLVGVLPIVYMAVGVAANAAALETVWKGGIIQPGASFVLFGVAGIEVSAFHRRDMTERAYNAALGISMALVILLYAGGQLLMAALVNPEDLGLNDGVFKALRAATGRWGSKAFFVACLLAVVNGAAAALPWLLGPVRGIAEIVQRREAHLFIFQGMFVASLGMLFLCTTASEAFWWLTAPCAATTQSLYLILFWAALRAKRRDWRDALLILGAFTSFFGLGLAFIPPDDSCTSSSVFIAVILAVLLLIGSAAYKLGSTQPRRNDHAPWTPLTS